MTELAKYILGRLPLVMLVLVGYPARKSDFAGNIGGNIVGNIEGYAGPTLAGNYPAGSLLVAYQHIKNFYQRW